MLACRVCGLERRTADFSDGQRRSAWPQCRTCVRTYQRELFARRGRDYVRARNVKQFYGLTLGDVRALRERQRDCCPICEEPLSPSDDEAAIDHCYRTGLIRGVLHPTCNAGLGHFRDEPELLRRAARYLEEAQRRLNDWDAKFIPQARMGRRPGT